MFLFPVLFTLLFFSLVLFILLGSVENASGTGQALIAIIRALVDSIHLRAICGSCYLIPGTHLGIRQGRIRYVSGIHRERDNRVFSRVESVARFIGNESCLAQSSSRSCELSLGTSIYALNYPVRKNKALGPSRVVRVVENEEIKRRLERVELVYLICYPEVVY